MLSVHTNTVERFSRAGPRGRGREWATLGVHPLSWLLSNNRLEKVPFVSVLHTSSNGLLLSNQDKGCTPSVAHSLLLPLGPALLNLWTLLERMRAPVREAFSYGIRHWIRHIHCDSMSYDQIRVKPWETIPRIIPRILQYGVWYSAECMHWNAKKSVVNHFKNRLKLW